MLSKDAHRLPFAALLCALACAAPAQAAPGDLDLTFGGGDGIVQERVGRAHFYIHDFAVRPGGALTVLGQGQFDAGAPYSSALAEFDANGAYTGFDAWSGGPGAATAPNDLEMLADGTMWTAGRLEDSTSRALITRHLATGALDPDFNGNGRLQSDEPNTDASAIVALPDGGALVALRTFDPSRPAVVMRLTPEGAFDGTFSDDSIAPVLHEVGEIKLRPGGGFLVWTDDGKGEPSEWTVTAYTAEGLPDETFGPEGRVVVPVDGDASLNDVVVLGDGRLLLVGVRQTAAPREVVLARLTAAGALDSTFGTGGMRSTAVFGVQSATEIADATLDAQGRLVAAGLTSLMDGDGVLRGRIAVMRFGADGALDSTFSGDGQATQQVGEVSRGHRVAIQPNGRIVVAGQSSDVDTAAIALVGFQGGNAPVVVPPDEDEDEDDGGNDDGNGNDNGNNNGNDQGQNNTATNTTTTGTTGTGTTGTGTTGTGSTLTNTARVTVRLLRGVRRGALRASLRWPASLNGKVVVVRVRTLSGRLVAQRRVRLDRDGRATVRVPLTRAGRALLRRGKLSRVRVTAAVAS